MKYSYILSGEIKKNNSESKTLFSIKKIVNPKVLYNKIKKSI